MKIPILGDILDGVRKIGQWFSDSTKWLYGILVAFVLAPIEFLLDWLNDLMSQVLTLWAKLDTALNGTHAFELGSYWAGAESVLAKANVLFPINFAISIFSALCVLWVVCLIIRFLLRFVPATAG